jgi:hypothetical protein
MSDKRRRTRRPRSAANSGAQSVAIEEPDTIVHAARPLPNWQWRTFPVFAALSFGLFIGVLAGVPAGIVNEHGNGVPVTIVYIIPAIMLGLTFSRLGTRYLLSKNWVKPRKKKR